MRALTCMHHPAVLSNLQSSVNEELKNYEFRFELTNAIMRGVPRLKGTCWESACLVDFLITTFSSIHLALFKRAQSPQACRYRYRIHSWYPWPVPQASNWRKYVDVDYGVFIFLVLTIACKTEYWNVPLEIQGMPTNSLSRMFTSRYIPIQKLYEKQSK